MRQVIVNIKYKNETFKSNVETLNEDEIKTLKKLLEDCSSGKVDVFTISKKDSERYISKKILQKSIITLVYLD